MQAQYTEHQCVALLLVVTNKPVTDQIWANGVSSEMVRRLDWATPFRNGDRAETAVPEGGAFAVFAGDMFADFWPMLVRLEAVRSGKHFHPYSGSLIPTDITWVESWLRSRPPYP